MSSVKKATITAVCIALCCILPTAFHALGLGAAFSPMHLPVLLCGLLCGWSYGLFCGLCGALVSFLLFGMPSAIQLIYMLPELAVYGLAAGLLFRLIRTHSLTADLYLSLVPSMLLGRIIGGLARLFFYLSIAEPYSLELWAGAYLVSALPAILLQLSLLPLLYIVLSQARLIPRRYS